MASLKNEQRTLISKAIQSVNLQISDFTKFEDENNFRLTYKDSRLYFEFKTYSNNYDSFKFQATSFSRNFNIYSHSYDRWFSDTLKSFHSWLVDHVKAYIQDSAFTDPWEDLKKNYQTNINENESFTKEEIILMEEKLDTFPEYAKTLKLEPSEIQILIEEVKGLRADLKTDKKKKWIRQVIGFLYDVAKVIVKDENARQAIFNFFTSILEYIPKIGQHILGK